MSAFRHVSVAGMGGSFALESVAGFAWNGWQLSNGISGRLHPNTHENHASPGRFHFEVPQIVRISPSFAIDSTLSPRYLFYHFLPVGLAARPRRGYFLCFGKPDCKRAVSFFDGQNLFHHAKAAFGHTHPNFDPQKLSDAICQAKGWGKSRRSLLHRHSHRRKIAQCGTATGTIVC